MAPPQAEILLLWLIGKCIPAQNNLILGIFSLNFYNASTNEAKCLYKFLSFLCSAVSHQKITISEISNKKFQPQYKDGAYSHSFLASVNGTRTIIDETEYELNQPGQDQESLKSNTLSEKAKENLEFLSQAVSAQKLSYDFEGSINTFIFSSPILVFSALPSIFGADVSLPIGETTLEKEFDFSPSDLMIYRYYIENTRLLENSPFDDEVEKLVSDVMKNMISTRKVSQQDLHIFMTLCELRAKSEGSQLTSQHISEVQNLFQYILQNRVHK